MAARCACPASADDMSGLRRALTLVGHVFNPDQLVQFEVRALRLFGLGLGVEAVLDVVVAVGRKLLDADRAHVMIGEGQAIGGDERSRAAIVEAHRTAGEHDRARPGSVRIRIWP